MLGSDKLNLMLESYTDKLRFSNYAAWAITSVTTNDCYSNMSTLPALRQTFYLYFSLLHSP